MVKDSLHENEQFLTIFGGNSSLKHIKNLLKKAFVIIIYFFFLLSGTLAYAQVMPATSSNDQKAVKLTKDTLKTQGEDSIKEIIKYDSDTQDHDLVEQKSYLTGNASLEYTDIRILADYIEINWKTDIIYARGKPNDLGNGTTTLVQGDKKYEYESFHLNFKTKKGEAENVRTEEQEGVIISKKVSRKNESINLMRDALYTTDPYFKDKKTKDPDYFLKTGKVKHYDKQAIITGPILMYIYKVPFPIPLPFSYIPTSKKSSAGFLLPSYGERSEIGFFIEKLGFFWPISDYWQAKVFGSFYTNGSWRIDSETEYKKRYKYSGGFEFNHETRIQGTKGLSDYSRWKNYRIRWNHRQDKSAHPSLTFSANVDYSNSNFYRNGLSTDNINNAEVYNNNSSSNIALSKNFGNFGRMDLKIFDLNQNFNTREIVGDFPSLNFNMNQKYPFSSKNNKFLQNLFIDYNSSFSNKINTLEENFFKKQIFKDMKTGLHQNVKFGSALTLLKYIRFSPNVSYNEIWDLQSIERYWNEQQKKTITQVNKGFNSFRTFGIEGEFSTTVYGFARFKKGSFLQVLRHKVDPKISFTYAPDFTKPLWGYYKTYKKGDEQKSYNIFEHSFYASKINNTSGTKLGFSISNNLEMKIRDESQSDGLLKIVLIDQLNLKADYHFNKKDFRWSDIDFNGNTSFTKNVNVRFDGSIDPYKTKKDPTDPSKEIRVDKIGSFTLKDFNLSLGYSLNNETFKRKNSKNKEDEYKKKGEVRYENFSFDKDNYAHYSIPWNLNTNLTYNYNKFYIKKNHSAELRFDGNLSPSPYWKIIFDGYYNLVDQKLTRLNFKFERDLRSFSMNFNWTPVSSGFESAWNFFIGIKADVLKDLKFDKSSSSSTSLEDF